MKTLRCLITLVVLSISVSAFSQNIITNEEVFITITGETTREELAQLRTDLQSVGLNFTYTPRFNQERMLLGIQFSVKADEEYNGSAENQMLTSPEEKVQFHMKKENGLINVWCVGTCE